MQLSSRILCFILSLLPFQLAVLAKVRGIPGVDYPNYSSIPNTSFKCPDFTQGFYADFETRCQVFHYCYEHRKESFLCPEGTTFNEAIKSCDYWYSSECDSTQTPFEAGERKLKQNSYNDVPLVPVKVQTNNIFEKMAALYEPKKHIENLSIKQEAAEFSRSDNFEDLSYKSNENYETDFFNSLRAQETLSNVVRENGQMDEYSHDFVKYEHDSVKQDDVDIVFHDNSVKPIPYNNNKNEVDVNSIRILSKTEAGGYEHKDSTAENKEMFGIHNSEGQTELFTSHYPQVVEGFNFSDLLPSDSLLIKRLSDNLDVPKKRRFRRKPTYVVLQTQESDESFSENTVYGVEQNPQIKEVYADKTNVYNTFHTDTPTSGLKEVDNKLKEDSVHMPDRKPRRNRKTLQTFTNESEILANETTKFVEEYQPTKNTYNDKTSVYHSSYRGSTLSYSQEAGNKPEDIKMPVKRPKRNRKKFGMLVDEPDTVHGETKELVKEYEPNKNLYADKTNPYHSSQSNTNSFILDKVTENKPEDFNISAENPRRNRTFGIYINEFNETNAEVTESTKLNHDFIMPANIMSVSFEADAEHVIFVSEIDTAISETDTFITAQPASTEATVLITSTAPNSITTLQLTENELEEIDNGMENFADVEEPRISFHKLENAEADVMTKGPHIYESKLADDFEKVTQNNQNFIPHLLNMNSEIKDQAHSEQDMDLDYTKNIHSEIEDVTYSEEEEVNSDDTINMNSEDEDMVYSEQEINSDDALTTNSEVEDMVYSEQAVNPHHIANMNSEFEDLEYSGDEMNPDDIVTHMIDEQSYGIDYEILKSDEQADQYDDQNNYGTRDNTFSGAYDMFSPVKSDSNNYDYVLISTLSPITTTDESSTVNVLDEHNNEHIMVYENSDSFGDEQMGGVEYEHIHYINNVKGINSEDDEGLKFSDEEIDSDMNPPISDLLDEEETKSFTVDESEDFESKEFHEILDNVIGIENTSLREDVNSDYVENAEQDGLEKSSDFNWKENVPFQDETDEEQQYSSDFELSKPPKNITEILNQANSFYEESFDSSIVEENSNYKNDDESAHIARIPEELFLSTTVVEHLNDKNLQFSKVPEKSPGSSMLVEGSRNNITYEYGTNTKISEESLENYIKVDENAPFAKIRNTDSTEAQLVHIHPVTDKIPYKGFDGRDDRTILTKTRKNTLLEIKLQNEVGDSERLNSNLIENENGDLSGLVLNQLDFGSTNTMKATSFQTEFVEKPQNEEEKPIDSTFHSSSMPLPANTFEQGLYRQNLLQDDENYQINRDKIYPSTFYKELDGKPKNGKPSVVNTSHNKRYRSLNSNFPLDEILENVDDLSPQYREPSLFSLLAPSQTVKRLFPVDFFGLKSGSIFSPPDGKISKPINVKKLAAIGKKLLAFKRAKLNDFKLLFNSFMKEI